MDPTLPQYSDIWGLLLFSHGWTWLFWGVIVVVGWDPFVTPGVLLLVLGGSGPLLGGVVMSGVVGGWAGLRDLARRIIDPRLVPLRWWIVVLGFFPTMTVLAAMIAV